MDMCGIGTNKKYVCIHLDLEEYIWQNWTETYRTPGQVTRSEADRQDKSQYVDYTETLHWLPVTE